MSVDPSEVAHSGTRMSNTLTKRMAVTRFRSGADRLVQILNVRCFHRLEHRGYG
jgi:hypothetical protein